MSDPRTDFFNSGVPDAKDDIAHQDEPTRVDARTAFFAADKPAPIPKAPPGPAPENTWTGAIRGDADAALAMGSRALVTPIAALGRTVNRVIPDWDNSREKTQADFDKFQNALSYEPRTPEGKYALEKIGKVVNPIMRGLSEATGEVVGKENVPAVADVVQAIPALGEVDAIKSMARNTVDTVKNLGSAVGEPVGAVRDLISDMAAKGRNGSSIDSPQSLGAARTAPDIEEASSSLQQAYRAASRKGPVHETALQNHLEADQHGVQLTEGQATRDPVQFSNEQNSTHGAIAKRFNDQEGQMVDALDNIRREAAPGHVQNDPVENGQIAVDSLKAYDEPVKAAIDAKYAAARKASATGDLQMDGSTFVQDANAALKPQSKFRYLPSTAKGILDDVEAAGGKMSLDDFQAYSTQLGNEIAKARAAGDGNAAFAVGKVNEALQKVQPLGTESAEAKALFDQARAAAKYRFDALDADPAYQAAVDDVSLNGVKRGKPSTLADKFLDKYVLQAPRANVERVMDKFDPDAQQAVAAHTLSAVRKAAVGTTGKITPAGYNGALAKYDPKLDLLLRPETQESLESLGRVVHNAKVAPPGNFVNYSKSGAIRNAATGVAQELGETAINAKTFGMGMPIIKGIAERNFVNRSLAPGAGLTKPMPTPSPIARASGGRVDHEVLLNRLVQRYKAAKKMNDAGTEPLLKAPDASIIKALDIAGRSQTL